METRLSTAKYADTCRLGVVSAGLGLVYSLFPVPHPAFRRLQYGNPLYRTESDEKLGVGPERG